MVEIFNEYPFNNLDEITYSKKSLMKYFIEQNYDLELYKRKVDPIDCGLRAYQDLLIYVFIKWYIPSGSKILDIGGGNSRIIRCLKSSYECWNIDKLEGLGNGPKELDTSGFHLVRDYIGNFNTELKDNYFDFVYSISTLEHVPQDQPEWFEKILKDMDRVLKPGCFSLHAIDVVWKKDMIWYNKILPYLFENTNSLNNFIPFESLIADEELFVQSETAYNLYAIKFTNKPYDEFGKQISYNILWKK